MISSSAQCRTTMTGLTSSFVSLGLVMTVDAYTTTLALYRRNGDLFDNIFSLMLKGRQKKNKKTNAVPTASVYEGRAISILGLAVSISGRSEK